LGGAFVYPSLFLALVFCVRLCACVLAFWAGQGCGFGSSGTLRAGAALVWERCGFFFVGAFPCLMALVWFDSVPGL